MPMETAFRSEERFTQAEFLEWLDRRPPGDIHHYELLDGYVVMTPPAGMRHGSVEAKIVAALENHVHKTGAGRVYGSSAGYKLPNGDILEPDASFISLNSLARGSKPHADGFSRTVPDLVVEILSPSTARRDRTEKKRSYARNGVAEYWIVSPKDRRITVFRLDGEEYGPPLEIVSGLVQSSALPGFEVSLETVFADCD
jgi:Uma2 family endonuclease